jgi:putative Mn2+ efflux pump MntP
MTGTFEVFLCNKEFHPINTHLRYKSLPIQTLTVLIIAFGLAMDCCAVSLAIGTSDQIPDLRGMLRLAAHLGIFQAGMTALGWVIGDSIIRYVAS